MNHQLAYFMLYGLILEEKLGPYLDQVLPFVGL